MLLKDDRAKRAQLPSADRGNSNVHILCVQLSLAKHSIIFSIERHFQSLFYLRATRCLVSDETVLILTEVSHCPRTDKTGCQTVPFLNSVALFITD
jgi:hypothetical protein